MKEIFLLAIMFRTIWPYLRSFCSNLQFRHSHLCDIIPRPVPLLQQEGAQSQVRVTHKQKLAFCVLKIIIIKDNPHNSFENLVSAHLIILSRSQSLPRTLAQLSNFWPALSSIMKIHHQSTITSKSRRCKCSRSQCRSPERWLIFGDWWLMDGQTQAAWEIIVQCVRDCCWWYISTWLWLNWMKYDYNCNLFLNFKSFKYFQVDDYDD